MNNEVNSKQDFYRINMALTHLALKSLGVELLSNPQISDKMLYIHIRQDFQSNTPLAHMK